MAGRAVNEAGLEKCRMALEAHYGAHGTIPSMAGLAQLWGYASKSSASRRIDQLIEAGVMRWSSDRRLAPGPAFRFPPDRTDDQPAILSISPSPQRSPADPLNAAIQVWSR